VHIGVVGHRFLDERSAAFTSASCDAIIRGLPRPPARALSALAVGADTVFAQAALRCRLALHAYRPHARYATDFTDPEAYATYAGLVAAARDETRLPYAERCAPAYRAAMRAIVDASDLVVAVWDGRDAGPIGGTAETVRYARARDRPLVIVDPLRRRVLR
jgi:hypothetical protein